MSALDNLERALKWEEKIAMGHRYRMAINSRSSLGDKRSEKRREMEINDEGRVPSIFVFNIHVMYAN